MRTALIALLATFPLLGHAQLYKWVDEKGKTHYSEKPPGGAQKSQTIRTDPSPPPVAAPDAPAASGKAADKAPRSSAKRTAQASANDSDRLDGSWSSATGAATSVRMSFASRDAKTVTVSQQWTSGGRSQVDTSTNYTVQGTGGAGSLVAPQPPGANTPDIPGRMTYRLDGAQLRIGVSSGLFAGQHALSRN